MSDIDRLITTWLEEEAREGMPDYLDETIAGIARTRQRPAWLSPERWLPMQLTMPRVAIPRAVSLIAMLVLLLVLVIAASVLIVGTQRSLPPPFGPAVTGLMAFDVGGDIIVANADGSNRRPFAATAADEFGPAFSRDGTRLAFWSVDPSGVAQVVVIDIDGRRKTLIGGDLGLSADERRSAPVWSPDGRMLLIATGSGDFYRINADGTDARQLGDNKLDRFYPTWSPDGTQIAFVFGSSTGGFLHVMDADGRFETQIGKGWGGAPTWSPDGSRLAYVVRVEEPADIFVATRAGAEWTESLVVGGPTDDRMPAWSNDGTRLAFLRMDADGGQLMLVPAIGGVERLVPTGPGKLDFARPCWTPDDRSIVALSFEPDAAYVVAPADGAGPPLRIDTTGINSLDSCGFQRLAR